MIPDIRAAFPTAEGTPYVPNNYDRRYHGPVTVRHRAGQQLQHPRGAGPGGGRGRQPGRPGAQPGHPLAATALPEEGSDEKPRYGLSLTLGGGEVRLIDLAAAYGAFATGGYRVEPYAIERIETLDGDLRLVARPRRAASRPRAAGGSWTSGSRS